MCLSWRLALAAIWLSAGGVCDSKLGVPNCVCYHENYDRDLFTGTFKSPMFPRSYCNDLDCTYQIEAKDGWAISLIVEHFDTETSHDYVEIYQTVMDLKGRQQLIKQYLLTGQTITQRHFYSAIGGGLLVKFVTDMSESAFAGFQMSFSRFEMGSIRNSPCPQPLYFAQATSRELPVLSSNFRTDSLCAFLVNSTEAVQITVRSLAPSLTLKIYETENFNIRRTGDVLHSMNGFALLNLPYSVTSRTSSLTVVVSFSPSSHGGATAHSYSIEFKSAPSVCNCPSAVIDLEYGSSRALSSPGFPLEYCDLLNCSTRVTIKQQNQLRNISVTPVIRAQFESFRVETDVDFLEMIDEKLLISLTDNAKSITFFTFDHAQANFRFVTDNSVTDIGYNFTLEIYQKPYYCACPGSPQVLQEKKYTQNYTFEGECRFMDCFWEIRRPNFIDMSDTAKFRIVMKFMLMIEAPSEFLEISSGPNLERNQDHLRIDTATVSDGGDSAERHVEFDNPEFVSVWYHREGDHGHELRNIYIEYEWRERCLCGEGVLSADPDDWKQLASPDYPTPYCNDLNCTYRIRAPESHNILINVTDFFTEINQDFLMLFDGNSTDTPHIEALSGTELFTSLIRSKTNEMTLLFTSDLSLSMRGFALWYKAEKLRDVSEDATASSSGSGFSFASFVIVVLIAVIIGLLIYLARLRFPSKFNVDTIVHYVKM